MSASGWRQQFFRYSVIGLLNFLIGTSILNLLAWATQIYSGPMLFIFSAIAFTAAVTNSYLCNRNWTFKDRGRGAIRYPLFCALTLVGLGLGSTIIFLMTTFVPAPRGVSAAAWLNVANVFATACGLLWNFIAYRRFVFTPSPEVSD